MHFKFTPQVGKELDALLIDPDAEDSPFDCFEDDTLEVGMTAKSLIIFILLMLLVPELRRPEGDSHIKKDGYARRTFELNL